MKSNLSFYKFGKFCIVGGIGAIITWGGTFLLTKFGGLWYMWSVIISTAVAMCSNYMLNSLWTFSNGRSMSDADYDWNAYYNGNPLQKWWKQKLMKIVVSYCGKGCTLDFGCGSSPLGDILTKKFKDYRTYTGIDASSIKINFMKSKFQNTRYLYGNANVLEMFEDCSFDNTVCSEVIEHQNCKEASIKLIRELARITKYGGSVIIATPDYNSWKWLVVEKLYSVIMPDSYAHDHKVRFNENELKGICQKHKLYLQEINRVAGCDMVCRFVKLNGNEAD
jgi:2-polyprenyl-3-methyl-5-hydroxy-6-metoxy-1,4-benzoquinol methylase